MRWNMLTNFINNVQQQNKDTKITILSVGDFGYWPRAPKRYVLDGEIVDHVHISEGLKFDPAQTNVLFCDGNHEDHYALKELMHNEVMPGVFYMSRGATHVLPDGRRILFMGGALSVDRHERGFNSPKMGWFAEEEISFSDMLDLPDTNMKIDILITHTCPCDIASDIKGKQVKNNCSMDAVEQILDVYRPDLWFFGHWHKYKVGKYKDTRWTALDMLAAGRTWWVELASR